MTDDELRARGWDVDAFGQWGNERIGVHDQPREHAEAIERYVGETRREALDDPRDRGGAAAVTAERAVPAPPLWLTELAAVLTYKPGWTFAVEADPTGWALVARVTVVCADHGTPFESEVRCTVSASLWPEFVARRMLGQIIRFEEHETRELFRVGGRPVASPHAGRQFAACACGRKLP